VAIGEVGLLGELRPVAGVDRRLREAARLGFERAIIPAGGRGSSAVEGIRVMPVANLRDALRAVLMPAERPSEDVLEGADGLASEAVQAETRVLG